MSHTQIRGHAGPALVAALVATLLVVAALPASAADTTTTFEVAAGGLAITAPASTNLGSASAPGTISASLGQVKVDDTRGVLLGGYAASASSTDFVTGGATAAETVGKASVTYNSGVGTPAGTVVCTGQLVAEDLSVARTAMTATGATGTNSCAWNPTVAVTLAAAAVAGTYTGTITHSVA